MYNINVYIDYKIFLRVRALNYIEVMENYGKNALSQLWHASQLPCHCQTRPVPDWLLKIYKKIIAKKIYKVMV